MNYSLAVFLINTSVRAVSVSYEPDPTKPTAGKAPFYTYKTMDASIAPGDLVTIPTNTRWNMTVARVEAVDVDVNFDDNINYKWLFGKIDSAAHDAVLAQETDAIATIRAAEKRRRREELARDLIKNNEELLGLSITNIPSALPAPAAPAVEPYAPPPNRRPFSDDIPF